MRYRYRLQIGCLTVGLFEGPHDCRGEFDGVVVGGVPGGFEMEARAVMECDAHEARRCIDGKYQRVLLIARYGLLLSTKCLRTASTSDS